MKRLALILLLFLLTSLTVFADDFTDTKVFAEQGEAYAQYNLGLSYAQGEGVQQNFGEAANWYRKAAEQGHVDAQFSLGVLYAEGKGVPPDYPEARKWFQKAAEQGDAEAQRIIGWFYAEGLGGPQNTAEAVEWFHKAAEQGLALAQYELGQIYDASSEDGPLGDSGRFYNINYVEAWVWYTRAKQNDNVTAETLRLAREAAARTEKHLSYRSPVDIGIMKMRVGDYSYLVAGVLIFSLTLALIYALYRSRRKIFALMSLIILFATAVLQFALRLLLIPVFVVVVLWRLLLGSISRISRTKAGADLRAALRGEYKPWD